MEKLVNFITKKYIEGRDYNYLNNYLLSNNVDEIETKAILKSIHVGNWSKRKRRAHIDFAICIIAFGYILFTAIMYFNSGKIFAKTLFIVSLFVWIPFFKSLIIVIKDRKYFDEL